jgi:hypothetical protein
MLFVKTSFKKVLEFFFWYPNREWDPIHQKMKENDLRLDNKKEWSEGKILNEDL